MFSIHAVGNSMNQELFNKVAESVVGSDVFKEQNFKACMKVLYNAGVTLLMS